MMSNPIGLLTFHFADNYGAVMQAYALQEYLRQHGHKSKFIDYQPAHVENGGSFWLPTSKHRIKANIYIAYQKYTRWKSRILGDHGRSESFQKFRDENLIVATQRFKSLEELKSVGLPYSHLICGSDQIWNSSPQFGIDPAYFLDFGADDTKKISFAASFGKNSVDPRYQADVGSLLKRLHHISVREQSGVEIVQRLSGMKANCVPDPTLMLDDFDQITEPISESGHIMSYVLRSVEQIDDVHQTIQDELGLKLVSPKDKFRGGKSNGDSISPSPGQWLSYFKNAEFVISNSFHGTVFAVIFRKPFVSVGISGKKGAINERAKSMLDRLGLLDRFVEHFDEAKLRELIRTPIDWDSVTEKLTAWRKESHDFLMGALAT